LLAVPVKIDLTAVTIENRGPALTSLELLAKLVVQSTSASAVA
jgi:hypothetical protein